jgi:hypothetical protein
MEKSFNIVFKLILSWRLNFSNFMHFDGLQNSKDAWQSRLQSPLYALKKTAKYLRSTDCSSRY